MSGIATCRLVEVPEWCDGMRLDRFLARRFPDRSRASLADGIRAGLARDGDEGTLRPASRVRAGQVLRLYLPGIAPSEAPPPFPEVLYEDPRVVVVNKPAGLLAHPSGTEFVWAVISLAKVRWPDDRVDLVHRLDRDTSGVLMLTRDIEANRHLKQAVHDGQVFKEYEAICRGVPDWEHTFLDGPIGEEGKEIRIKMMVRPDGLEARTEVRVLERRGDRCRVACVLHTGRTHQIRVHLADAGLPLLGDRLYGVPPDVFIHSQDVGVDGWVREQAGAPHHALHARRVRFPHPDDSRPIEVVAPLPDHLRRWWERPEVLPHDGLDAGDAP